MDDARLDDYGNYVIEKEVEFTDKAAYKIFVTVRPKSFIGKLLFRFNIVLNSKISANLAYENSYGLKDIFFLVLKKEHVNVKTSVFHIDKTKALLTISISKKTIKHYDLHFLVERLYH
jgi:hypothetical protein